MASDRQERGDDHACRCGLRYEIGDDLEYRCFTCQPRSSPGSQAKSLAAAWASRNTNNAAYWRKAYEELVRQTGRDLNDGLGLDPRKAGSIAMASKRPSPLPARLGESLSVSQDEIRIPQQKERCK